MAVAITNMMKRWCFDNLQNKSFFHHALIGVYFDADGIAGFVGCRGDTDVKGLGVIGRNLVAVVQQL